jgi:hypothetical protein
MNNNNQVSLTHMVLLQQFNHRIVIPVEEIAEPYLNLARRTALNMAKTHSLPFPCFRLGSSNKSPWCIHLEDLVSYIDRRVLEERAVWQRFQIAS